MRRRSSLGLRNTRKQVNGANLRHYRLRGTGETTTPSVLFEVKLELQDVRTGYRGSDQGCFRGTWLEDAELHWTKDMVEWVHLEELEECPPPRPLSWPDSLDDKIIHYVMQQYRARIWKNPEIQLYSGPRESREEFLERCREHLYVARVAEWKQVTDVLHHRTLELEKRLLDIADKEDIELRVRRMSLIKTLFWNLKEDWNRLFVPEGPPLSLTEKIARVPVDPDLQEEVETFWQDLVSRYNGIQRKYEQDAASIEPHEVNVSRSQVEISSRGVFWS